MLQGLPLFLLPLLPQSSAHTAPLLRQVSVDLDGTALLGVAGLLANDFDVLHRQPGTERFDLLCSDAELDRLRTLDVPFEVRHQDLARFYEERLAASAPTEAASLGAWLSPPFGQGSIGGYYSWDEVGSVLDQISAAYPSIVSPKLSIGQSHEGRDLWLVKLSDNPGLDESEPEVRFDAMHHAREPESMQATLWTLLHLVENYGTDDLATSIVDEREIWFIPVVNPDGYVRNQQTNPNGGGLWRKNRRDNGNNTFGVDLNRNYPFQWGFDNVGSSGAKSSETYRGPSAASEPEVAAMVSFIDSRSFRTALSSHTYSDLWLYPWGYVTGGPSNDAQYRDISMHATEINGYRFGPAANVLYLANGVTIDYDHGTHGTLSWTPEIGSAADGFWPDQSRIVPLAEKNLDAFLRTALSAGSYPYVQTTTLTDAGDGDGYHEKGETIELVYTLENLGLDDTTSAVTLTLESSSPYLTLGQSVADLGPMASGTSAENASAPLSMTLDSATPPGEEIEYVIQVQWDGLTSDVSQSLIAGRPLAFVSDDLEDELGWLAGQAGDTASAGLWEWGNPKTTIGAGGVVASPEDDNTPGSGKRCYITGNGATAVGVDDVDDGFTTLISPCIDLSAVSLARVSYARWFADLIEPDDLLEVSISDDDGASWVTLETVEPIAEDWTTVVFDVGSFVSLSECVRLRFLLEDDPENSTAEACIDDLTIEIFEIDPRFNVYGRALLGGKVAFHTASPEGGTYGVFESTGTGLVNFALINGPLLLDPIGMVLILSGGVPLEGVARDVVEVPSAPSLTGVTLYYQALVSAPNGLFLSNRDELTFE